MAVTATATVPGRCWVERMLIFAFMAFLGVNGLSSDGMQAEEELELQTVSSPLSPVPRTQPPVMQDQKLQHGRRKSVLSRAKSFIDTKSLLAGALLVLVLAMMAYSVKVAPRKPEPRKPEPRKPEPRKEEEDPRKPKTKEEKRLELELENLRRSLKHKEKLILGVLDGVSDKIYTLGHRLKLKLETVIEEELQIFNKTISDVKQAVKTGDEASISAFITKAEKEAIAIQVEDESEEESEEESAVEEESAEEESASGPQSDPQSGPQSGPQSDPQSGPQSGPQSEFESK